MGLWVTVYKSNPEPLNPRRQHTRPNPNPEPNLNFGRVDGGFYEHQSLSIAIDSQLDLVFGLLNGHLPDAFTLKSDLMTLPAEIWLYEAQLISFFNYIILLVLDYGLNSEIFNNLDVVL